MPRRSTKTRRTASAQELSERFIGPAWAQTDGFQVRNSVKEDKRYRCPWCEGWIAPGVIHVVAVPDGNEDGRRHFHAGCWRQQNKQ